MSDKLVPIVFSTDDNYVMPTSVAIKSLVNNFSGPELKFVILVQGDLSDKSLALFDKAIMADSVKTSLQYISVDELLFGGLKSHIEHISMATYFRLLLPILLSDYNKCLYLDGDICVSGDVNEILNIQLTDDEYVAGVKAFSIITSKLIGKKRLSILKIDSLDSYINAGVLLMNLHGLRSSGVAESWIELAKNDYPVQDQDVINVACYQHIHILPPRFNSMPAIYRFSTRRLSKVFSKREILDARNNPCIIHYAEKYKPWKFSDVGEAQVWRKYYSELMGVKISNLEKVGIKRFADAQKGRINYILNEARK